MFDFHRKSDLAEIEQCNRLLGTITAKLAAISRSMAMIEFSPDGIILDANENFCKTMGYSLEQIRGKHHRIFCEQDYVNSQEYRQLWHGLARGEAHSGTFARIDQQGRELWLEASYMPVFGPQQQVTSVIKLASDITRRVQEEHESESLIKAINVNKM